MHDTGHILGSAIIELWSTEPGRTTKGSVFRRHQIKRPADREIVMKGRYEFEDARQALGEARLQRVVKKLVVIAFGHGAVFQRLGLLVECGISVAD